MLAAPALDALALNPTQFLGIPLALIGAVFLSIGAQLQHRGVAKVDDASAGDAAAGGLDFAQLRMLLQRPSWVTGTLMLGAAIVLQLTSLAFAPLIVVQPLGAFALVVTSIVNARVTRSALNRLSVLAICLCVAGVGAFVLIAAFQAREVPIQERELVEVLSILGAVLVLFALGFAAMRRHMRALVYVVGAGVLYGFVATLAKVVIARLEQRDVDWLTAVCVVALVAAVVLGAYFVQNAYASGPPDLVIAGLTVIDPMVAVTIGIAILNEAAQAQFWAVIVWPLTGVLAIAGVVLLARHHPQVKP
ncbi:DMT family transporter [Gryllotalpicola ginsengisoli]|uniref:DMT family transporter n=1 Tax=Gryllotalpicola ginsengisoli TaxID=444608 RepID=UPI0003B514B5|nr:DMT family transporter [Gryllotalpicola ginsengisoli]